MLLLVSSEVDVDSLPGAKGPSPRKEWHCRWCISSFDTLRAFTSCRLNIGIQLWPPDMTPGHGLHSCNARVSKMELVQHFFSEIWRDDNTQSPTSGTLVLQRVHGLRSGSLQLLLFQPCCVKVNTLESVLSWAVSRAICWALMGCLVIC